MNTEIVRVLMVEDNLHDLGVVRRMLRDYPRARFQIEHVGSTEACVELLQQEVFDLILLDHYLPGEDGLSFLQRVAENDLLPPVIMLTGEGDERLAVEALQAGAYDYLPKRAITSDILAYAIHRTLEKFRLNEQLGNTEAVIFALANAVEAKDPTTEGHLQRMASYSVQLGRALGLGGHELTLLRYGGILHDIGKIAVAESVLRKPESLNEAEWAEMRKHPVIGEKICAPLRFADEVGPIILHHHERWDGTGYVDGLSGEAIPLLARIVSVVDAFDAMTSDRPYRRSLSWEAATQELEAGAGSQWDPTIIADFLALIRHGQFRDATAKSQRAA
jgi:putative two-component system response regulator